MQISTPRWDHVEVVPKYSLVSIIHCFGHLLLSFHQSFFLWIQLSDFGLAITDGSQEKNNIKLSGTLGYVAPEYLLDGKPIELCYPFSFTHMRCSDMLLYAGYIVELPANQIQYIVSFGPLRTLMM